MEAADVLTLLDALDQQHVRYWLDGGWGVDCLLGEQTRPHSDLDLVIPRPELDDVRALLEGRGFAVIRDWLPTSLAFRDEQGRQVDLHPVDPTADGGGDQVLPEGTWHYAPPAAGSIGGRAIRCAPAEDQVAMHLGYEPRGTDIEDVRRLVERFDLTMPPALEQR